MPGWQKRGVAERGGVLMAGCRIVVACAAAAVIGLAFVGPRTARGDDGLASLALVSSADDRAIRSLARMPHVGVVDCPEPEVWVVSTRRLPGICTVPVAPDLAIERFIDDDCAGRCGQGTWVPSDLAALLGPDEAGCLKPIVIFIHGNRYEAGEARQQGVLLARHCAAACPALGPVRTVIFSWPSGRDGILLKDGRAKYDRTYTEGRYLAWLLGQIDPSRPVGIIGYSFGALITVEALDNLVAAEQAGRTDLLPWRNRPARTNLMFVAPALRCDAFSPRGPYRRTLDCVDGLSLIINPRDKALEFFPILDRHVSVAAMGHTGMPRRWIPTDVDYAAINAENIIGKKHGLPLYLASPTLTRHLCAGATGGL